MWREGVSAAEITSVFVVSAVFFGVIVRALTSSDDDVAPPPPPPPAAHTPYLKSRGVATALALLLGGIGMHKFYLGRPGQGMLYLLFCWTLIPAVVGFLEGISYATSSEESFHAEYG